MFRGSIATLWILLSKNVWPMMTASTLCVQEELQAVGKTLKAHSTYQAIVLC